MIIHKCHGSFKRLYRSLFFSASRKVTLKLETSVISCANVIRFGGRAVEAIRITMTRLSYVLASGISRALKLRN